MILISFLLFSVNYDNIIPNNIEIIVYSRNGCSGCKEMEPIVKELKNDGYNISISKEFDGPVPTIVVLVDDIEVRRHTGGLSKAELIKFIEGEKT